MAESGFVVFVPEAERLVNALRLKHDESARLGVPAHITVLFPFMEPTTISSGVAQTCARAIASHRSFPFRLGSVGRFPATAYLEPKPAAQFIALTQALFKAFPKFPPFRGEFASVIPHLTVAHGSAVEAELVVATLKEHLAAVREVSSVCSSVVLMENSSGIWKPMHVFPLAPAPGT